jgi:hypothetical protein
MAAFHRINNKNYKCNRKLVEDQRTYKQLSPKKHAKSSNLKRSKSINLALSG